MGKVHFKCYTIPHWQYIIHIHLLLSIQCGVPRNMKSFLLCVFSLVGVSLATDVAEVATSVEEIEDQVKDISFTVDGLETSLKALDDSVKDELKDLKQLVEDEFDDLKYILNIVLGKLDKVLHKPKFGYGPGPKYGHKYGGYGRGGYGHKYGPPKKYGYGYGHGYGKKW